MTGPSLPARVLAKVQLRSLLLQGSWNFERMQSLGFLYAMAPALRRLYRGEEELQAAMRRHLEYFNTHPFMASPVLGAAVHLEERQSLGEAGDVDVAEFKRLVMAPYAAVGDALFWGGLRPLAAVTALLFAAAGSLWAPVVFLLLFNLPHLRFRLAGFRQGYDEGVGVVQRLQRRLLPDLAMRLKDASMLLLGVLCAWLTVRGLHEEDVGTGWGLAALPAVALLAWLLRRGISILLLGIAGAAALLGWFHFA